MVDRHNKGNHFYSDTLKLIKAHVDQEKRERAHEARCNLLAALAFEMENIPEAMVILRRYINAHLAM